MIHQHCTLLVTMAARHLCCSVNRYSFFFSDLCVCVLPGAEFRRCAAEADHRYLQGGGAGMLGGSAERPGWQQRGAQGRVEPPAETQRGARSTGRRVLLLITLFILTDRRQLLHQTTVAFPVHLRDRGIDRSLNIVTLKLFYNVLSTVASDSVLVNRA